MTVALAAHRLERSSPLTDPTTIPNLAVWLKADDVAVADGAAVTTWTDAVAALAFTQATSTRKPTKRNGVANGHHAIEFDGTTDLLAATTGVGNVTSRTAFVVARGLPALTAGTTRMILTNGTGTSQWTMGVSTGLKFRSSYVRDTDGVAVSMAALGDSGGLTTAFKVLAYDTSTVGAIVSNNLRAQGALVGATSQGGGHRTPAATVLNLGSLSAGANMFEGQIAELLFFTRSLTGIEAQQIRRYLAAKYATAPVS